MAIHFRLSLLFRQNMTWVIGSNSLLVHQKYQVFCQHVVPKSKGIGGARLGAGGRITAVWRPVTDAIWVFLGHTGEMLFFLSF